MGRAFEYRKAAKLKRWGHMAKTFTRLGKQIAIAVKAGGPEPENNPTLRSVIATCKRENMPKDNIERAIKNAMGKDQSDYKGMTYEGYGPHGVAVFVDTLTDNTTRTVADVRSVFNKFGGNLGTMGSLAFLFDHKCVFTFKKKDGVDPSKALADALNDAKKKAGTSRGTKEKGGKSSVAGALADFQKSAGGAGGGGGGEGDGPGGGGIYDVYMGQVILAVRPNWSMPTYSRANLSVQVNVKLDPNGKVLSCTVARSSGRAEVDASAVNAVIRTKVLPAPPTPDQQELLLTFTTQEMMGRR